MHGFAEAFRALDNGDVDRLVLPVENSTTGSVLPVLDRLPGNAAHTPIAIVAEHLVEVRHALLGPSGASLADVRSVLSHPEALAQAENTLLELGIAPVARADTAGAVREVAATADPTVAALGNRRGGRGSRAGRAQSGRDGPGPQHDPVRGARPGRARGGTGRRQDHDPVHHRPPPGALALALTELGLRGANLTRIESRPGTEAWSYRFFVDLVHPPGPEGLAAVIDPPPATLAHLRVLGSYRAAPTSLSAASRAEADGRGAP